MTTHTVPDVFRDIAAGRYDKVVGADHPDFATLCALASQGHIELKQIPDEDIESPLDQYLIRIVG